MERLSNMFLQQLYIVVLLICVCYVEFLATHRITEFGVPRFGDPRDPAVLSCGFDLGDDDLFSVKFYKDEQEFFRYKPLDDPTIRLFPLPGINISTQNPPRCVMRQCTITLTNISRASSPGTFRCEVSTEAPKFRIVFHEANMSVLALPRGEPKLLGLQGFYAEGDLVLVNCSAPPADPPPVILFFINEQRVVPEWIVAQKDSPPDTNGLIVRSLALRIAVTKRLFTPYLRLRCDITASPQATRSVTQVVALATKEDDQNLSNQKLEWPAVNGESSARSLVQNLLFIYFVIFLNFL